MPDGSRAGGGEAFNEGNARRPYRGAPEARYDGSLLGRHHRVSALNARWGHQWSTRAQHVQAPVLRVPGGLRRASRASAHLARRRTDSAWLKAKVEGQVYRRSPQDGRQLARASPLSYAITGDKSAGREARRQAVKAAGGTREGDTKVSRSPTTGAIDLLTAKDKATAAEAREAGERRRRFKRAWRSFHNGNLHRRLAHDRRGARDLRRRPVRRGGVRVPRSPSGRTCVKTFDNVFADGAWGEGYNYNHHVINKALKVFLAMKTATGVDWLADAAYTARTTATT